MSNRALLHARGMPRRHPSGGGAPATLHGWGGGGATSGTVKDHQHQFCESKTAFSRNPVLPNDASCENLVSLGEKEASNGRRSDLKSKLHPSVAISILQVGFAAVNLLLQGQRKGLHSPELPYPNLNSL